jgi:hypothetical protein
VHPLINAAPPISILRMLRAIQQMLKHTTRDHILLLSRRRPRVLVLPYRSTGGSQATVRDWFSVPCHPRTTYGGHMSVSTLVLILLLTFGVGCALDHFTRSYRYSARLARASADFADVIQVEKR